MAYRTKQRTTAGGTRYRTTTKSNGTTKTSSSMVHKSANGSTRITRSGNNTYMTKTSADGWVRRIKLNKTPKIKKPRAPKAPKFKAPKVRIPKIRNTSSGTRRSRSSKNTGDPVAMFYIGVFCLIAWGCIEAYNFVSTAVNQFFAEPVVAVEPKKVIEENPIYKEVEEKESIEQFLDSDVLKKIEQSYSE